MPGLSDMMAANRDFGATCVFGRVPVFEGFYDVGTIGRCLVVCKFDEDNCESDIK